MKDKEIVVKDIKTLKIGQFVTIECWDKYYEICDINDHSIYLLSDFGEVEYPHISGLNHPWILREDITNDVTDNQLKSLSDVFLEAGIDPYGKENHRQLMQDDRERRYWKKDGLVKFGLENTMRLVRGGNFKDWDSVKEEK